jgi:Holliday junction resolvase
MSKKLTAEGQVVQQCKAVLAFCGWDCFRIHQSLGSEKGISDMIAIKDGRVLFIEYKTMNKKSHQSVHQVIFQQRIEAKGGTYLLIRSSDQLLLWLRDNGDDKAHKMQLLGGKA